MNIGRAAPAIIVAAAANVSAGGEICRLATRPSGPPGSASLGWIWTSSGSTRWATSRSTTAVLHAMFISSAWSEPACTVSEYRATAAKAPSRSTSWKAPRPLTFDGTWPDSASTGARSTFAS